MHIQVLTSTLRAWADVSEGGFSPLPTPLSTSLQKGTLAALDPGPPEAHFPASPLCLPPGAQRGSTVCPAGKFVSLHVQPFFFFFKENVQIQWGESIQ